MSAVVLLCCAAGLVLLALVPGPARELLARLVPPTGTAAPQASPRETVPRGASRRVAARWVRSPVRRGGARRRRAVIVLCRVLVAELRAGQPPGEALRLSAAEAGPEVAGVRDAESMRALADRDPDLWPLAYLAACWEVSADTGAGPADVVEALAGELTEHEEQRSEVMARTAGPRTTAIVLGGLPLVGVLMSAGLGGSPLVFLFTTPLGLVCLACGAALDLLGAWWTLRMVRGAVDAAGVRPRGRFPAAGRAGPTGAAEATGGTEPG
ncbi:type II secretion system F family protein [Nocardiopsis sp. LOL_012]|uniref:type II secretion system F family protein n=1 Tax=Nocardiopsis sp. LOL_012 TaxID=3345409 RepID=UPI003A85335A